MSGNAERVRRLEDLVSCSLPIPRTLAALGHFPWDADHALVTLGMADALAVVRRFLSGDLSAANVEEWANAVEVRDDIDFESREVQDLVFELANPAINKDITPALANSILERYERAV